MVYNRRKIEADYKVRADGSAWDIVTLLRLGPAFQSFRVAVVQKIAKNFLGGTTGG